MANRFLRGTGNRNWNDTANWSTTSGGAGGASVPTLSDAVIFDQNSGVGDVTLNANASCASFNSVGLTQIVRVVSSVYTFSNYGDLTLNGTLSKFAFTGTAYYYQRGTGGITTNGNLFLALNRLYIDGVGITVTNLDDMITTGKLYLANGTLLPNGFTHTWVGFETATGTKTLTLSNSIVNCTGQWSAHVAVGGFTLDSGTSTINIPNNDFYGGGKIYYNVNLTKASGQYVANADTFYNLTRTSGSDILSVMALGANITVSNNLTLTGSNASNYRLLVASLSIGTPRTITCNGTVTASNVDFRDVVLAGTCNKDLSAITGGSGDCGGNSGIIFTTAQPQYFKKYASTANVGDAANWFTDLALTVAGRVPLPQDLGSKFLATSFDRACTVSCNVPRIPCLDMSEVVNTVTWTLANTIEVYGSYVLGANITQSGNQYQAMQGRGNFIIKTFNKPIYNLGINGFGGIFTFQSDFTIPTTGTYMSHGNNVTIDFNDFNITIPQIISSGGTATGYFGNGLITLTSITAGTLLFVPANFFCENSHILFTSASGSANLVFAGAGKTYNKIQFSGSHTGNFDISGSNNIAELIIDSGRKVRFTAGTTNTIAKATIGANVTLDCVTASTYTLALADITTAENANIKGCIAPVSKFFAEANSVDSGSNTNVVFGDYFTPQEIILENRIN